MDFLEKLQKADEQIRKDLGKDVEVLDRSTCCTTCTIYGISKPHYIAWKIFEDGANENATDFITGKRKSAYASWDLTKEQLKTAVEDLKLYFYAISPINEDKCIQIVDFGAKLNEEQFEQLKEVMYDLFNSDESYEDVLNDLETAFFKGEIDGEQYSYGIENYQGFYYEWEKASHCDD